MIIRLGLLCAALLLYMGTYRLLPPAFFFSLSPPIFQASLLNHPPLSYVAWVFSLHLSPFRGERESCASMGITKTLSVRQDFGSIPLVPISPFFLLLLMSLHFFLFFAHFFDARYVCLHQKRLSMTVCNIPKGKSIRRSYDSRLSECEWPESVSYSLWIFSTMSKDEGMKKKKRKSFFKSKKHEHSGTIFCCWNSTWICKWPSLFLSTGWIKRFSVAWNCWAISRMSNRGHDKKIGRRRTRQHWEQGEYCCCHRYWRRRYVGRKAYWRLHFWWLGAMFK